MGRKNKNVLGSAVSGAAAAAPSGNPYAIAAGGLLGGFLGSQNDTEAQKMPMAVPQEVVNRLYAQSVGAQPTVGELRNNAMFDKSLAQQIAAAGAARGVNAGLASRNVARLAAEQGQAAAQANAQLSAEERNQALARYLQAQQMNAGVNQINLNQENAANKQADTMLGEGLKAGASALATDLLRRDAVSQANKADISTQLDKSYADKVENAPQYEFGKSMDGTAPSYSLNANLNMPTYSTGIAPVAPSQYSLNYNSPTETERLLNPNAYNRIGKSASPSMESDRNAKTKIKPESMKVMSDERQKDLIKTEDLPANNNLQNQNMQAQQPAAQPAMGQAQQATPQASAPQAQVQAQAAPVAPPATAYEITPEMLQKAAGSARGGGNVSDIQNVQGSMKLPEQGISQDQLNFYANEARRQETRGGPSYRDLYQQFINEDNANRAAQMQAYGTEQANVQQQNQIKDAQRMARLNKFYTGLSTPNQGLIASQYAPPVVAGNQNLAEQSLAPQAPIQAPQTRLPQSNLYGLPSTSAIAMSDETTKENKKKESNVNKQDFNPKSFLDKLQAYSYEYKDSQKNNPEAGEGRFLSPMAQDVEKAGPVGKSMVTNDEQGNKIIDYGKGFGAILASQAHLNERLSQIEKMYGKKK